MVEFKLPDVGEGLTEAEVLMWHVSVGDTVAINDILVEIETAKSVVELPSPAAGVIGAIHIEVGETVAVGTVLITIADTNDVTAPAAAEATEASAERRTSRDSSGLDPEKGGGAVERPLVLVGTGPSAPQERRRRLHPPDRAENEGTSAGSSTGTATGNRTRATPPVRLRAKQLGVDLSAVEPASGTVIRRSDVESAAATGVRSVPEPLSRETRLPVKGVRRATAAAMVASAFTAPHVTGWVTVDVTRTMDLVARLRADREWSSVRITPLVLVARAFLLAIRRRPLINSHWDDAAQEVVVRHYVNLGIAAATPRGLLVPNVKDAHEMDLRALAVAIEGLVDIARAGKSQPPDLSGGTATVTNIGAFGVDAGTPILNPGEAAILAFGAVREMPWVVDGAVVPRRVTQLAMSFDHRLVDGELGSLVLMDVARLLEDPGETFLHV